MELHYSTGHFDVVCQRKCIELVTPKERCYSGYYKVGYCTDVLVSL